MQDIFLNVQKPYNLDILTLSLITDTATMQKYATTANIKVSLQTAYHGRVNVCTHIRHIESHLYACLILLMKPVVQTCYFIHI